jgi:hypothetical protein
MSSTANMMRRLACWAGRCSAQRCQPSAPELRQLNTAMAVRGPHHCDVGLNAVEPDEAVHRASLDLRLAPPGQRRRCCGRPRSCGRFLQGTRSGAAASTTFRGLQAAATIPIGERSTGSAPRSRDVCRRDTPSQVLRRSQAEELAELVVEVCLIPIADGLRHIRPISIVQ